MFKGVYTAIVTPFNDDESVDYETFNKLIDFNIDNGVTGIVPCGTTGESPTLSHDEHDKVIEATVKHVDGRVPVIAGTGSNCTKEAIRSTQHAEQVGADACLLVNPYYNKPTQEGLYRHFKAIADSVKFPCIVYNIKGRTAINVETSTLIRLAKDCKNITAVKEASGDLEQMKEVIKQRPDGFSVLSGDDNMTLDLIKSGGDGVISVASNLVPDRMSKMVNAALDGDMPAAEDLNKELAPLFEAIFIETNPIPVKAALAMKGMLKEVYRLPICELMPESREELTKVLKELKVL
ncbi:MAG: 4-hydroxy-tetrahydrodipicolinate synthase [Candidatus Woesearchaeota archaeon]|nr:4-hydroxy-tetrahydrodipicolinate synthase [Candidatus Woesearchaeota archaeon]MDP7457753.1 4-hydroxy-tetrahydrodipicolinate synthase [Candidatus Woesearchaeota archaeon]